MFVLILSFAKCLTDFTFVQCFRDDSMNSLYNVYSFFTNRVSSTLTKLKIEVNTFTDCLYILDGSFDCLTTLIIDIQRIRPLLANIDDTVKILLIV